MTQRSSLFLMANLGSEVARLYTAQGSHVDESRRRVLGITEQLLVHPELRGRTKEVEILREVIEGISTVEHAHDVSREDLEAYFMPFATKMLQK